MHHILVFQVPVMETEVQLEPVETTVIIIIIIIIIIRLKPVYWYFKVIVQFARAIHNCTKAKNNLDKRIAVSTSSYHPTK